MISDDERHEVARRLRYVEKHAIPDARISDNPMTVEFIAAAVFYDLPYVRGLFARLADLVEPSCDAAATHTDATATRDVSQRRRSYVDRDALLALADELDSEGLDGWASGPVGTGRYARRIREALGVFDD